MSLKEFFEDGLWLATSGLVRGAKKLTIETDVYSVIGDLFRSGKFIGSVQ